VLAFVLAFFCLPANAAVQKYQAQFFDVFDTFSQVTVYSSDKEVAQTVTATVYETLLECHQLFDIYNEYEGINNLKTVNDNAGIAPVKVDERLFAMVAYGKEMYYQTNGRMNIAMGSVLKIWHRCRTEGLLSPEKAALPDMDELKQAQRATDIENIILDEENQTIFLADPNMSLDVGALAKGWAVELAADSVQDMGAEGVLLNIGGNVRALGHRGDGSPWRVGVQDPANLSGQESLTVANLSGLSLVTSGDYQRSYTVDGRSYHHIIDPETLMPAEHYRQVTVITEDSGLADALSTALFVMPLEEGLLLLDDFPGVCALWVCKDGTVIRSEGFAEMAGE